MCPVPYKNHRAEMFCMFYLLSDKEAMRMPSARSEFLGGWQAVSLGGGVTVMEKREILAGWVTKVCLKCAKKLG